MKTSFSIKKLVEGDLDILSDLTPEGWNDITVVYQTHINQDYFFPIKLVFEETIVGVAELIINDKIGWLGNIIVDKKFRNRGLGRKLTQRLVEMANAQNCDSIYLLATSMGKPVYQKLGFQENGKYLFFKKSETTSVSGDNESIIPYDSKYKNQILTLDQQAMGEDRSKVLIPHLQKSFLYKDSQQEEITGFFMPTLGDGVIISNNNTAGFSLINEREKYGMERIIVPEECTEIIDFLMGKKYTHFRDASFMYLGKMKTWNPQMVYSRVGGYLG